MPGHPLTCVMLCRVRWSPCGALLASASDDRTVRVWGIPAGELEADVAGSGAAGAPNHCEGSNIGSSTATATASGSASGSSIGACVAVRDAAPPSPQALHVLWGHTGRLWDCCFGGGSGSSLHGSSAIAGSPTGNSSSSGTSSTTGSGSFLVTASEDCSCRIWCLTSGQLLTVVPVRVASCDCDVAQAEACSRPERRVGAGANCLPA